MSAWAGLHVSAPCIVCAMVTMKQDVQVLNGCMYACAQDVTHVSTRDKRRESLRGRERKASMQINPWQPSVR